MNRTLLFVVSLILMITVSKLANQLEIDLQYTSSFTLAGLPVLDIALSDDHQKLSSTVAVGWVAVGQEGIGIILGAGVLSTGLLSVGVLQIGLIGAGVIALGRWSIGVVTPFSIFKKNKSTELQAATQQYAETGDHYVRYK